MNYRLRFLTKMKVGVKSYTGQSMGLSVSTGSWCSGVNSKFLTFAARLAREAQCCARSVSTRHDFRCHWSQDHSELVVGLEIEVDNC